MNIQELSISERIMLAEKLWDSVASESLAIDIPDDQIKELDRRLDAFEKDKNVGSSWEEVKARIIS